MNIKTSAAIAGAILLAMLSACASQPAGGPSAAGAQIASAPSGQKCEIDAKRVCQEMKNAPVIDAETGQTQDQTEREQNSNRTDSRTMSFQIPNGSMVEVQCEINNQHSSVVYAHTLPGPPLTLTDVSFLQNAGYCAH